KDASHLWGKTTTEAEAMLRGEISDANLQIALIGPAGENLVYTACIVHKYNVAGRTGIGSVMGSKNLKAVCVAGKKKIPVAHPELFTAARQTWLRKIDENPFSAFFKKYGSAGPLDREDEAGILAVKNFSQTSGCAGVEKVSAAGLLKFFTTSHACFACPVHCIQSFEVTEGQYKGTKGAKLTEGCNSSCGPSCGNTDPGSLFKLTVLANEFGVDILDFGLLMAIAMDWYEHGIITADDTDGIALTWGNHESMVKMLEKIVRREGIGNILANGAVKAAEHIGRDAQSYVSSCKGMVFGGVDPRVLRGSALCYATATRGGDHLRGGVLFELPSKGKPAMPPEVAAAKYGTADVLDPFSYNKAGAANFCQDMYTVADCLEVCKFITEHVSFGITLEDMGEMLYAVTGVTMDTPELRTVAARVFTLERAFLVREGITRKDDFLHGKWTTGPVSGGRYTGAELEREKWEGMLEQYYATRGWEISTGIPSRETLDKLGLHDVAQDLQTMGKLT
ncbi:MAG: aldehyde ferredoxin oxidoreductase C-terminal domain-containing protein, partial [Pseudomonadota bacterium]